MKKCISLFSWLFFLSLTCHALAVTTGTTSLTTYYPPPTAAYNKVKLSTNATSATTATSAGLSTYCTGSNNGVVFLNTTTGILETCTAGAPQQYCSAVTVGALIADNTGTLHICKYNQLTSTAKDSVYPQQCYNSFCSYDSSVYPLITTAGNPCQNYTNGTSGICPQGFTQSKIDSTNSKLYDLFNTSTNTVVVSIACCTS